MILVDTTPLVARCDPTDGLHATAVRDLEGLSRMPLVVVTPVLTESSFLLPREVQRRRLRRVLTDFSVASYVSTDEAQLWLDVLDWLARYAEHEPDVADGYLAVVSGLERRAKVWRTTASSARRGAGPTAPVSRWPSADASVPTVARRTPETMSLGRTGPLSGR